MEWKYDSKTKAYKSDKFLIVKKIAHWGDWFTIYRKEDNVIIKSKIKKLSKAKAICKILA